MQERVHIVVKRFSSTRTCRVSGVKTIRWSIPATNQRRTMMSDERNEAEPIELGYIEDLGDMISVQEGSTVSRTVMQKAGGNVVLFSFDTGEELSEHTAAMPVFVQTLKGRLKVTGNGRTVELVPGGLAYFPTRIPHAIYAEEPSVMMLTMVTPARDNIGD